MPDAVQHEMLLCWSGIHMWDIGPGPAQSAPAKVETGFTPGRTEERTERIFSENALEHHFVLQSIPGDKHNNQIDSLIQLTIWLFGMAPTFWAIT